MNMVSLVRTATTSMDKSGSFDPIVAVEYEGRDRYFVLEGIESEPSTEKMVYLFLGCSLRGADNVTICQRATVKRLGRNKQSVMITSKAKTDREGAVTILPYSIWSGRAVFGETIVKPVKSTPLHDLVYEGVSKPDFYKDVAKAIADYGTAIKPNVKEIVNGNE